MGDKAKGKDWKEFERLVARIEGTLAPLGAVVRSPDHIVDLVTGSRREVDASIRFPAGTTSILITIECRKRTARQDVRWIEELATKLEKIGASKTIAVSSTGFSAPARKTARLKGIELRRLHQITADEITKWLQSVHLIKAPLHITFNRRASVEIDSSDQRSYELHCAPPTETAVPPFIRRNLDGECFSPLRFLSLAETTPPGLYTDLSSDGASRRYQVILNVPPGELQVLTLAGPEFIRSISFDLTCRREIRHEHLSAGQYFEYAALDGDPVVHRAEFPIDLESLPMVLGLQSERGAKTVRSTLSWRTPTREPKDSRRGPALRPVHKTRPTGRSTRRRGRRTR